MDFKEYYVYPMWWVARRTTSTFVFREKKD